MYVKYPKGQLIGYIHYEAPPEEKNFSTMLEFINAFEVREDDEDFKTTLMSRNICTDSLN